MKAILEALLIGLLACAQASAANAKIRASLAKQDEIWIGQRVVLVVELLAPGTFASAPAFDLPQVPGVIFVPPTGSPILGTETIDDVSYTSQRHEVALYVQRAGKVTIPSFTVRFDSTPEFSKPVVSNRLSTMPLDFTTKMPPGAEGIALVITTTRIEVKQTWAPDPGQMKAKLGDAFTRTIKVQADDVPAMVLPAFAASAPKGIRVYSKPAAIEDRSNRGQSTGERVDNLTYVCEQVGSFTLPDLSFAWWNPSTNELHREVVSGVSWQVVAPVANDVNTNARDESQPATIAIWSIVGCVMAILISSAIIFAFRSAQKNRNAEPALFAKFEQACRQDRPRETLAEFRNWFDQIMPILAETNVDQRDMSVDIPELVSQITMLQAIVFGPPGLEPKWSAQAFKQLAQQQRKKIFASRSRTNRSASELPPINP